MSTRMHARMRAHTKHANGHGHHQQTIFLKIMLSIFSMYLICSKQMLSRLSIVLCGQCRRLESERTSKREEI